MPLPSKKPSLQDIADKTGFSRSTISLALRNHPSIPEKTRKKITKAAVAIRYQPNPLVAALMTQIRDKRRIHQEQIALIFRFSRTMAERKATDTFYPLLYRSIRNHAKKRGFGIDEFYLGKTPMSDKRLSSILSARGIHGVIFFPGKDGPEFEYPTLNWDHFATVLIGYNTQKTNLHQVASDYTYDIETSLKHITEDGFSRIGLAITDSVSKSTNHTWLSRFLLYQQDCIRRNRIPPHIPKTILFDKKNLLKWYEKHRPEVILISGVPVYEILTEAGIDVPGDVRLVNMVQRGEEGLAGMNPHTGEVGRASIDLLASLLQGNQIGLPDFPRSIAIKGHWTTGSSYPE